MNKFPQKYTGNGYDMEAYVVNLSAYTSYKKTINLFMLYLENIGNWSISSLIPLF